MAKLVGPMFSLEARNKFGDAIVYFPWKGRNVARSWTIPSNPRDIDQKMIRQKFAICGYNTKAVELPAAGLANGSSLYQALKAVTPATQIWNAYFVKTIMDYIKTDANLLDLSTKLAAVGATVHTAWENVAADLGLVDLTGVEYATTLPAELQLFAAAYGAYDLSLSGDFLNMSTHPCNWNQTHVSNYGSEYQTTT